MKRTIIKILVVLAFFLFVAFVSNKCLHNDWNFLERWEVILASCIAVLFFCVPVVITHDDYEDNSPFNVNP